MTLDRARMSCFSIVFANVSRNKLEIEISTMPSFFKNKKKTNANRRDNRLLVCRD